MWLIGGLKRKWSKEISFLVIKLIVFRKINEKDLCKVKDKEENLKVLERKNTGIKEYM